MFLEYFEKHWLTILSKIMEDVNLLFVDLYSHRLEQI